MGEAADGDRRIGRHRDRREGPGKNCSPDFSRGGRLSHNRDTRMRRGGLSAERYDRGLLPGFHDVLWRHSPDS